MSRPKTQKWKKDYEFVKRPTLYTLLLKLLKRMMTTINDDNDDDGQLMF